MSAFDLTNARVRIGLGELDTSRDEELQQALDFALAVVENYCDRRFAWKRETASFYWTAEQAYMIDRLPVTRLISVVDNEGQTISVGNAEVHYTYGILKFDRPRTFREIAVTYEGGFQVFPADLRIVLWDVFDYVWGKMQGGGTVQSGEIQSITIPDVGTVRYNTSASGANDGGNAGSGYSVYGPNFFLLEKYRRVYA